jgi:hypothetical protein
LFTHYAVNRLRAIARRNFDTETLAKALASRSVIYRLPSSTGVEHNSAVIGLSLGFGATLLSEFFNIAVVEQTLTGVGASRSQFAVVA